MNEQVYCLLALVMLIVGAGISAHYRRRADQQTKYERTSLGYAGLPILRSLPVVGLALSCGVLA